MVRALFQILSWLNGIAVLLSKPSIVLEVEPSSDERDGFCGHRVSDAENAFGDARLAADVVCSVEDRRLAFAQGTRHLKPSDRRIGGLQRLESPHGTDQLLQLAMIGLDDIGQIPYRRPIR